MAARRGNHPAPLEVMRNTQVASNGGDSPPQNPESLSSSTSPAEQPSTNYIRLPRGLIISAIIITVGLIALAYTVGHSRGVASIKSQLAGDSQPIVDSRRTPLRTAERRTITPNSDSKSPIVGNSDPQSLLITSPDGRIVGRNYLQLARLPVDSGYAEHLIKFLESNGVDAIAVFDDNKRFYLVFELTGFDSDLVSYDPQSAYQLHKAKLKRLGERWKQQGGTSNLADMYYVKYKGE